MTEPAIKITVSARGSLRVEGGVPLYDSEGNQIPTPEGRPYSLCRCGDSSRKPFCDGSHKTCDWDPSLAPQGS